MGYAKEKEPMYEEILENKDLFSPNGSYPDTVAYGIIKSLRENTDLPHNKIIALAFLIHDLADTGSPSLSTLRELDKVGYTDEEINEIIKTMKPII